MAIPTMAARLLGAAAVVGAATADGVVLHTGGPFAGAIVREGTDLPGTGTQEEPSGGDAVHNQHGERAHTGQQLPVQRRLGKILNRGTEEVERFAGNLERALVCRSHAVTIAWRVERAPPIPLLGAGVAAPPFATQW